MAASPHTLPWGAGSEGFSHDAGLVASVSPRRRRRRRKGPSSGWRAEGSRCPEWPWLVGRGRPLHPLVAGSSHLGLLLFFCPGNTINLLKNNPDWCHFLRRGRASPPAHRNAGLSLRLLAPLRRHPRTKCHPRCLWSPPALLGPGPGPGPGDPETPTFPGPRRRVSWSSLWVF